MFKTGKTSYESFEEWKADLERVRKHPNDTHLIAYVVKCVDNSSESIRNEIRDYLSSATLESNPMLVLQQIAKANPGYRVVIKSAEDIWFEV